MPLVVCLCVSLCLFDSLAVSLVPLNSSPPSFPFQQQQQQQLQRQQTRASAQREPQAPGQMSSVFEAEAAEWDNVDPADYEKVKGSIIPAASALNLFAPHNKKHANPRMSVCLCLCLCLCIALTLASPRFLFASLSLSSTHQRKRRNWKNKPRGSKPTNNSAQPLPLLLRL